MVCAHKDDYVVSLDSAPCVSGVHRDTALFFAECTPNDSSREGEASNAAHCILCTRSKRPGGGGVGSRKWQIGPKVSIVRGLSGHLVLI